MKRSVTKEFIQDIIVTNSKQSEPPPLLYDLNSLQIDANLHFALPASHVLTICQQLYEKKLITYPRTNSRYLPPIYAKQLEKTIKYATTAINTINI